MLQGTRLLLWCGTAALVLGISKVHAAYVGQYDLTGSSRFSWALVFIVLLCGSSYAVGLPDLVGTPYHALLASVGAAAAAALGVSLLQLFGGTALLPRFVVFSSAVAVVPMYMLCARLAAGDRRRREGRDRVVAVVTPAESIALARDLGHNPERPGMMVRAVGTDEVIERRHDDEQWLVNAVQESMATVLVLDRVAQNDDAVVAQAARLHECGVRVRTLALFYDEWLGKLPVNELERMALMFDIGEVHRVRYGRIKRLLDLVVAISAVPLVIITVPFVLVGNVLANRGPLLYRQTRVGKGGSPFEICKFRTMTPNTGQSEWTTDDDPRVTPFGRFLRRCHLDELPQVVNILRGELAIVGPRPEQPRYVEELGKSIAFYGLRHLVRPGLTGWAQVKCPYGADQLGAVEKLQYEFYYLRHQCLSLDLRILGRTLRSVIGLGGR